MDVNTILNSANDTQAEIINHRRTLHQHPEVGVFLPKTKAYVMEQLRNMGYEPTEICESGIVTTITGEDTGRCILLRADMDGLKVTEDNGLEFQSTNGNMHACGHDMHTAMLLGAARLFRKHQSSLKGTVKLVFQPDEEGFTGAKAMLAAGVLNDPTPQAALALHVNSGTPTGMVLCGRGTFMAGCTVFRITVTGVGCHGAMPETGVDPINIAAHIQLALQELTAREIPAKTPVVLTVGHFSGGEAPNIIPQEAVIEGTIRTFDRELSTHLLRRITEIAQGIATLFRGSAVVEELSSTLPLINNFELVNQLADCAMELFGENNVYRMDEGGMGSEDFAVYGYELPCAYLLLGAGSREEGSQYGMPMHNNKVVFHEDCLSKGAALFTYCAMEWLANK